MKRLVLSGIYCLLFFTCRAYAVDPWLDWKTIESEHLYVHYADGNKAFAERALAIGEAAHKRLTGELEWNPLQKTHLVLSDETDFPNGFATPLFFNRTVLFLAPPTSVNTLEDFDDWFSTLLFHEYTHIVHLDKSAGSPEFLRRIFGRFLFLFPNVFQPSWVTEGLATHKETYPERGIGRGQSTMYASMMREEVAKGLQPISHVNLPVTTWPAGTTRYLYGVYFMEFIAEKYGEDRLQQWVDEYSDNLVPFFINTAANQVFDKNLTPLWEEYQQWLKDRFEPEIKKIKKAGIVAGKQISKDAYRTESVRAISSSKGDEVYYVRNGGYKRASLVRIDAQGNSEELLTLNNGADLDLHPKAGILLTQNEYCNNYTVYKDIYLYDQKTDELERLTECGRYLFASWHPDGRHVVAVHHENGKISLHLLDLQTRQKKVLWQADNAEVIGQVDVSPDGKQLVASMWRRGSGWNLELFDLAKKRWKKISSGTSITANPQFTPDGNILFSYEVNGVYNINRYMVRSGRVERLTNLVGGAFQSSQASKGGAVYYAGYTAEGYAIYKLDDARVISRLGKFPDDRLQLIDYKTTSHQQRDYSALSNMYPRWWFPTYGYTEQRSELGLTTTGNDALGIHNYSITASYDSKLKEPAGVVSYAYVDVLFLSAQRINEIRLDENGDVNRLSKRNIASAILAFPDRYIQKQYNLMFAAIYDRTADDKLAAGVEPFNDFRDNLLSSAFLYNSANINPLSISEIDGMRLRLVAESSVLDADYSGQVYTLDWRQYIRTGRESVFALRFVQGWGTDTPRPFKLGGEGINDDAILTLSGVNNEPVFNVRSYALRGYKEGLPQLRGRRTQLLTGEWRFPLQRIEKGVMTPPVGLMQWFGGVFAETGAAYENSPQTYYSSAGVEVTADINVFYGLTLRSRLGYARGFDKDIGEDRVYLKIGSSF